MDIFACSLCTYRARVYSLVWRRALALVKRCSLFTIAPWNLWIQSPLSVRARRSGAVKKAGAIDMCTNSFLGNTGTLELLEQSEARRWERCSQASLISGKNHSQLLVPAKLEAWPSGSRFKSIEMIIFWGKTLGRGGMETGRVSAHFHWELFLCLLESCGFYGH